MTTPPLFHEEIIKGERLQQLANMYLGMPNDFQFNPLIAKDTGKHCDIRQIVAPIYHPQTVFWYGHLLPVLAEKIHFFQNKFRLITHNSDQNITSTPETLRILNHPTLDKWYAQNVGFEHPQLMVLPIGLANNQWTHGDLSFFRNPETAINADNNKTEDVYFYFNLSTNFGKRNECYKQLRNKLPFLDNFPPLMYQEILSTYSFCICPEGNGADTHRFWEALYVKCIPIVLRTPHIEVIQKQMPDLPMVVLESWADLDVDKLVYDKEKMSSYNYYDKLKMSYWKTCIQHWIT
jgi:hypothetical protein